MVDRVGFNSPSFGGDQPPERPVRFGAQENQMEDEFVRVERQVIVEHVAAERIMGRSRVDYITNRFSTETASEFAETLHVPPWGEGGISGLDFLKLLMTPEAVDPYDPPHDSEPFIFADYGVSEAQVREEMEARGLPGYFYDELLNQAHHQGLIYELYECTDIKKDLGRAYYGVPPHVREALALEAPVKSAATETLGKEDDGTKGEFLDALVAYAEKVDQRGDQELREYGAELMQSARKAELIEFEQIPEGFRSIDVDMDTISKVPDMLMTMLEKTYGTGMFDETERLAEMAVAAKILGQDLFVETLTMLRD